MIKRSWKIKEINNDSGLSDYIKSLVLRRLLLNRGIEKKVDAENFLNPKKTNYVSPYAFVDMEVAISRIISAIEANEKILIWGDFDADGVTSTALLHKVFSKIGANFTHFIPNRKDMGHGLNSKKLIEFISREKVKLVITVDCGISNVKEAKLLKNLKVDLIITDHHKMEGEIPCAYAIINANAPNKIEERLDLSEIKSLCNLAGVGVAFKLAQALIEKCPILKGIEEELLCLACVGTISDLVPLFGENRKIATEGLEFINAKKHKGISKLFEMVGKQGVITSTDIAFVLTPRINAMGRLSDVKAPFELLCEENPNNFQENIETLNNYNKIRQALCEETLSEVLEIAKKDKNKAIIHFNPDWNIGIIGIVASGIVEATSKPVFLMTSGENGQIRCSIRSPKGYNVYEILKHNKDIFQGFGGHALAGGFSFDSNEISFEQVKIKILNTIKELYGGILIDNSIEYDIELETTDLSEDLLKEIKILEPFGEGNPAPLFCIKDTNYFSHKFVGKETKHLKLECKKDNSILNCVWWQKDKFNQTGVIDLLFVPKLNIFNDIRTIQLELIDVYSKTQNDIKIYDHRKKDNIFPQINDYLKKDGINLKVYAKKQVTFENIKGYETILKKVNDENGNENGIMFFDYPSNIEEFKEIFKQNDYKKIHLLAENFAYDIEFYIKNLLGMLKYAHNKKQGDINISKMAELLGVNYDFVQVVFEIFEHEGAIKILSENKIEFIKSIPVADFKNNTMYEILNDEFQKISEFKKLLSDSSVDEILSFIN
ncbi:MAG: single-stranded-DNA-specific exonuclease RecJ [Cyanobacteria bacterium SIG30]|nr:single-stranded-DNA-specific exonuclease RecJ [Cyanobacteria bacterium SIG30]